MKNLNTVSDWLDYMGSIHVSAIDMGLERVLPVAKRLGVLNENLPNSPYVFMVAGTNGKGSTTSLIANICQNANLKTALYQSPHLVDFNERISINGEFVGDDELINAFCAVETARVACGLSLSFFEMTTLAAFYVFKQANCDVWVLEIGLGGRLDVVNIINPDVCVITNVGIDHTEWLGDTHEKIGYEKAGILRDGGVLIFGERDMPQSVADAINEKSVTCHQYGQDFLYVDGGEQWVYSSAGVTLSLPKPYISLINASVAISAVLSSSLAISHDMIAKGLKNTKLAGRFDVRDVAGRTWVFDVGHNEHGIAFLMSQFVPFYQNYQKNQSTKSIKLHFLFSMLADKDIDKVIDFIGKISQDNRLDIDGWYVGTIDNTRALDAKELVKKIHTHLPNANVYGHVSIAKACQDVLNNSNDGDVVLCFGSFHTIGESMIELKLAKNPKD